MSSRLPCPERRSLLRMLGAGAAGLAASLAPHRARAHDAAPHGLLLSDSRTVRAAGVVTSLDQPALMVAGPATSTAAAMAQMLAPLLSDALRSRGVSVSAIGGRDGVTGANAFEALTNPDGETALLVPGTACIAWLAGDPRVHFDAGRWVPALTSFGSGALLARARGATEAPLRVAASTPAGPELSALLGLSLLGIRAVPVFGLAEYDDALAALAAHRVDAILLTGSNVPARFGMLAASGLRPVFSLGANGSDERDPALASVRTVVELHAEAGAGEPVLLNAWRATASAARLDAALVLPQLTPASLVARWRGACRIASQDPGASGAQATAQLSLLPAPGCVAALASMVADENTLLTLRRWLASRTDWRPA